MTRKFILLFAAFVLQQTAGFAQNNPLIKYLPDNAVMVMNFNVARLAGKVPAASLQDNALYQEMMKDTKVPIGTLLLEPVKSGIDFFPGIFLVMTRDTVNEKPDAGVNIFIKLSDAKLFTLKMQELFKDNSQLIKSFGTDHILQTEKGMTIGWNKELLVMTSAYDSKIKEELQSLYNPDTITVYADSVTQPTSVQTDFEKKEAAIQDRLKMSQRNICFNLLAPTSQNSLSVNTPFNNLMSRVADIKTWNSGASNPLFGGKMGSIFGSGLGKLKGFTGSSKSTLINFENGKVVVENNNFINDDVAAIYQKYPVSNFNNNLFRRLPAGKLLGYMNISYNTQMGLELLQKTGMKDMLDDLKKPFPFDINLLYTALGNNIMLAVVQAPEDAVTDSITKSLKGIQLIVAMPLANKEKFDELKRLVNHLIDSLKEGKEEKFRKGPMPLIKYNDSLLVISFSPDVATAFLNSSGMNSIPDVAQSKTDYPMLMNINLQELLKLTLGKKMAEKEGKEEQRLMNMFDQFIVYGGKYENGSLNTTMEFKFTNASDNSLKQLLELINMVAGKKEGRVMSEN